MADKVAVVTGSNKGIGLAIVKGLCKRFHGTVYLTSRDEKRGKTATEELNKLGLQPVYHQLDVSDILSVEKFRDHIQIMHGGIDVLVNNAAIAPVSFKQKYDESKETIDINYRGVKTIEELLFPLLRENGRVLNISSDCGHLSNIRNKDWLERLSKKNMSKDDINAFVDWYLESVQKGTFDPKDFADDGTVAAYRVSKVALSALTILQQKELSPRGICVNSMHPGLVSTDMTMGIGFLSPDEAAETPLYLLLDAPETLKGAYVWFDRKVLDWYDHTADYYFKRNSVRKQLLINMIKYPVKFVSLAEIGVGVLSVVLIVAITKIF